MQNRIIFFGLLFYMAIWWHPAKAESMFANWFERSEDQPQVVGRVRFTIHLPDGEDERDFINGTSVSRQAPPSDAENAEPFTGDLNENSAGFEAGFSYYFSDYFALDFTTGYQRTDANELIFGGQLEGGQNVSDTGSLNMFPQTFTFKYIIAPYGQITPYIGAGYNYTLLFSGRDLEDYENASGPVLQAGLDWWSKNSPVGFTFDVKKYFWDEVEIDRLDFLREAFGQARLDAEGIESFVGRIDQQPWVISGGLSYRF